ncbi:hypothetical protein PsorP6_007215 [Peronosclerospora sorghi]|uniref:Uncharacterized protein n=1 Tax=Peronosclerospora sorghi TaxID=230839 RepID=A0ACC0WA72_9STRA|nr:hypothetical protein PsorP6_007215 [Peronosclerospora sorghi]
MQVSSRKRDFASFTARCTTKKSVTSRSFQGRGTVDSKVASVIGHKVDEMACTSARSALPVVEEDPRDRKVLLEYPNLVPARLIRRYKRFLADVVLLEGTANVPSTEVAKSSLGIDDGKAESADAITVYCPNTGPMIGLLDAIPHVRVQLSKSCDPKRKYAYTLEMIQIHVAGARQNGVRDVWVGIHSTSANRMIEKALTSRWLTELGHYDSVRREVKYAKNSRVDFVLSSNARDGTILHEKYIEVKSVTLAMEASGESSLRCAVFPDTVSTRAQKHVTELTELLLTKAKAPSAPPNLSGAIIFLVQRDDCDEFAPSIQHDKKFTQLCAAAAKAGIQLLAYACALEPDESNRTGAVRLLRALPLHRAAMQA